MVMEVLKVKLYFFYSSFFFEKNVHYIFFMETWVSIEEAKFPYSAKVDLFWLFLKYISSFVIIYKRSGSFNKNDTKEATLSQFILFF